jgi:peptide/nickel transport system permease protein
MYMEGAPWMVVFPGLALATTIFGLNVFGDAVRDLLDPRLRGGVGGGVGRFGGVHFKAKEKALARARKKLKKLLQEE